MILQVLINFLITFSFIYLFVSGFSIIYNVSGVLHFPHSSVMIISSYLLYTLFPALGLLLSTFVSILVGIIVGISIEFFIYSFLRANDSSDVHILLSSLGVLTILQSLLSIVFGSDTKIITESFGEPLEIATSNITSSQVLLVLVAFMVWALFLLLRRTTLGKSMRAVAADPQLALTSGIRKNRVILISFALGSGVAAIGGIFNAQIHGMAPNDGLGILLDGIVAMVVAGSHHPTSLLLGSALLAALYKATTLFLGSQWQEPVSFTVLVVLLLFGRLGSLDSN